LYDQAVAFVSGPGRPSISAVQREFKIGYNRAGRLIAQMEQNGIVTPMDSKGGRQLVGAEQPVVEPQAEQEVAGVAPFDMSGLRLGFQPNVAEPAAVPDTEPGPATVTQMPVVPAATNFQPAPSTSMTPEEAAADAATRQQDATRVMYEGMAAKLQAAGKPIPPELAARLAALQPAAPTPVVETPAPVEAPAAPVVETPAVAETPVVETPAVAETPAAPAVEAAAPETEVAVAEPPAEPVKPPSITEAPAPFSADIKPIKSDIPTLRDIERGWFYPAQPMMLGNLLVNDNSYTPVKLQVTDNAQFHSGKMEQAPISVEFRPDSVSGAKQAALPTGGGVYNTNVVAPQAVQSVSMTTATAKKLPAPIKAALAEKFDAATSGNDITYTRKKPVEQEAEAAPTETVAPTEEAPKPRVRRVAKAPAPAIEAAAPAVETPATAETVEPATQPQGAATEPVVQRKGKRVVKPTGPAQAAVAEETTEAATEPQGEALAPVTTDEQSKQAQTHADEVGGTVVWQEGDLALIRGHSILSGQPVYVPAKGALRGKVDVDSFTGKQLTPKEIDTLRQAKKDAEATDADRHAKEPFIKHDANGLAFSKNVPAEYQGIIEGWKKLLGVDARIYVTTIDDAKEDRAKFTGPHRAIGSAALDQNERGSARYMSADDSYYIAYKPSTSKTLELEIIAHELGHVHEKNVFKKAPAETQAAIKADFDKWLASNKGKTAREHIEGLRAKTTGKTTKIPEGSKSSELKAYWSSFSEWYADQVSRWSTTTDKPLSVVEKFFAKLGAAMRRFYTNVMQQKYLPAQSIQKFLDGIAEAGENNGGIAPAAAAAAEDEAFFSLGSVETKTETPELKRRFAGSAAPTNESFVAGKTSNVQALRNTFKGTAGLAARQKALDSYASMDEALKKGFEQGIIDSTEAGNVQFALRMGQQRNHFAGMALTNGPLQLIKDVTAKGVQYIYRSVKGANLQDVAKELNKSGIKADKLENYFTVYMVGQRANVVGWDKVNVGNPAKAKTEYNNVMQIINANPKALTAFKNAEAIYTEYNKGLINFLEQTGTITKALAQELNSKPYVPYYRVDSKSGDLLLDLDKSVKPVRIGNIKDEPRLQELVGGEQKIMGIFDSAVQNTFLLTDMALRNQAIKESAFVLNKLGMASYIGKAKKNLSGKDVVRFKVNGEDHVVVIDTDQFGIPAKLIVEGMEGIKTMIPSVVRAMGFPADVLRKFVTRNPVYALRQVVRDSMNSFFTTGIDSTPVLSALKQGVSLAAGKNSKAQKLMESGAISNLVFTGGKEDAQRLVEQIATGKSGWTKLIGKLDALSLAGDATTRITIYEDSIRKGLTEQEALLRTLESQNFTRRGTSASLQQLAAVVPFLNAQLQGLDVLYRSSQGKMPFEQQMRIRSKFFQRAVLMSASTVAYAALMEDDERYKKAKPEERYGNWFLVNPFDPKGDLIRVPIPFEIGLIFKAVPEAIYNTLKGNDTSENAARGIFKLLEQSNPFTPIPAALKPGVEVFLGASFFGGPIESARELAVEKSERIRPGTSAGAELLGKANMLSPVQIDHLIRGHFGALGVLISDLAAVLPFGKGQEVQERTKNLSEMRVIGTLFQPAEGRGIIDEAYRRMKEIDMARKTYKKMLGEGRTEDANAYLASHRSDINLSQMAGAVENKIGKLAELRRSIEARPNLTTEQKDAQIKNIIAAQNRLAQTMLTSYAQTARQ
jgi:hypothetical protein